MIIETRASAGIPILVLKGSFDSPQDLEAFSAEMDRQGNAGALRVILDLHLLAYLNSNAVGRIVKYKKKLQAAGGDLAILQPTKSVREVLELLQLHQVLKPFPQEADAIASLQKAGAPAPSVGAGAPAVAPPAGLATAFEKSISPPFDVEVLFRIPAMQNDGIGTLLEAQRERVRFLWRPGASGVDSGVLGGLAPGGAVELRLRIPRFRKATYLELAGTITGLELVSAGAEGARVTVEFPGLSDDGRRDLEQYAADLRPPVV